MFASKKMAAAVAKTKKQIYLDPSSRDSAVNELKQIFLKTLPRSVPPALGQELFTWGWEKSMADSRDELLGDVCDLFAQDYDEQADPLTREDWEFIRDAVEEFDEDLELELLQYIMIRVVDHRALD